MENWNDYLHPNLPAWDLARYLDEHSFTGSFLKKIVSIKSPASSLGKGFYTIETLILSNSSGKLELLKEKFRKLSEKAYDQGNNLAYQVWNGALLAEKLAVWVYSDLNPQGGIYELDLSQVLYALEVSKKELMTQRAWSEWREGTNEPHRGILALAREKGISLKAPQWQYAKALDGLLPVLKDERDLVLFCSPHTYHQLLKRKIMEKEPTHHSLDSYEWKGRWIPIVRISEMPNLCLFFGSPSRFSRIIHKELILSLKTDGTLRLKGSYEITLKADSPVGIIDLS